LIARKFSIANEQQAFAGISDQGELVEQEVKKFASALR